MFVGKKTQLFGWHRHCFLLFSLAKNHVNVSSNFRSSHRVKDGELASTGFILRSRKTFIPSFDGTVCLRMKSPKLLGGLEPWNFIFHIYIYGECHHPNWLIFFRGVGIPPTSIYLLFTQHFLIVQQTLPPGGPASAQEDVAERHGQGCSQRHPALRGAHGALDVKSLDLPSGYLT